MQKHDSDNIIATNSFTELQLDAILFLSSQWT
uniref:Uncharacterized protein n=1 Tax=Setaria italica TaxID=4555 RepID=K4A3P1_SETIT